MFPFASLLLFLVFFSYRSVLQRYQRWQWQNRLQLKKHLPTLEMISAPINGFELSRLARQDSDAYEYVYGEIDSQSFIALLSLIGPDSSTVFYDLGSGSGKTVLACAMVFEVKKACGVELFPILDQSAKQQLAQLKLLNEYQNKAEKVSFICGSFLDIDLSEATIIFISATGLFGETWEKLNYQLEQLTHGPIIVTTSKKLKSKDFTTTHQTRVKMSWGVVNAYIQQSIRPTYVD